MKILRRAYERQAEIYPADAKGAKAFLSVGARARRIAQPDRARRPHLGVPGDPQPG